MVTAAVQLAGTIVSTPQATMVARKRNTCTTLLTKQAVVVQGNRLSSQCQCQLALQFHGS